MGLYYFMMIPFYYFMMIPFIDTVGAGDSFLAALIDKLLNNFSPQEAVNFACAVGALVASAEGANPVIGVAEIETFVKG